jgi:hypothetical protein
LNAAYSLSCVLRRKKSVAAVLPPPRMPRTSSSVISRIASPKMLEACGAAASAARFMLRMNSSTCFW